MRAVLLGPLFRRELRLKLRPGDLRVGVDAGVARWRALGLAPNLVVGDWDSLGRVPGGKRAPGGTRGRSGKRAPGADVVTLPREKDASDLAHALREAAARGAREVLCAGFVGGRLDQQLGVLLDLCQAAEGRFGKFRRVTLVGPGERIEFLSGAKVPSWGARLPAGTLVSIFAPAGAASGVTLRGFKFPLESARLSPGTRGLSNRARGQVKVSVKRGALAVFVMQAPER